MKKRIEFNWQLNLSQKYLNVYPRKTKKNHKIMRNVNDVTSTNLDPYQNGAELEKSAYVLYTLS